jgi:hypothetical protein
MSESPSFDDDVESAESPTPDQLKLAQKRESGELSPHDYDLNFLFMLNEHALPLTRKDVMSETGNQAVVLTRDDFAQLGSITLTLPSGEVITIEAGSMNDPVFIVFPEDLGD